MVRPVRALVAGLACGSLLLTLALGSAGCSMDKIPSGGNGRADGSSSNGDGGGPGPGPDGGTPDDRTVAQDGSMPLDLAPPPADLPPPPPPPPADGGDGAVLDGGVQPFTLEMQIGPIDVAPGQEFVRCVEVKVGNDVDIWVRRISSALAPGSHHLILYRLPPRVTQERPTPFDCNSFETVLQGGTPLYIAQTLQNELPFPTDVALKFYAGQIVRLEAHYINASPSNTIQGMGVVRFDAVPIASPLTEADLLFYGPFGFTIPAHATNYSLDPYYGGVPSGIKVFGMTTHTHQLGVDFRVEKSMGGAPGELLHDNANNWDNPPLVLFDPEVTFAQGEGLRWTCTYTNPNDFDVSFGESANDEMCFLWAYYYPSRGLIACIPGEYCPY
jgi:hypothetical protein